MNDLIKAFIEEFNWPPQGTITILNDDTRVYIHGASPVGGIFSERRRLINDMKVWCSNTLGERPYAEYYAERWCCSNDTFWFKTEQDRMMFVLRWS